MVPDLTPDEIEESNARIQEFIRKMKSVPESERTLLTSEKFAGPVGRPVAEPETDPDSDGSA